MGLRNEGWPSIPIMYCDFCDKEMDRDETGMHIIDPNGRVEKWLGGHMKCAVMFQKEIMTSGLEE